MVNVDFSLLTDWKVLLIIVVLQCLWRLVVQVRLKLVVEVNLERKAGIFPGFSILRWLYLLHDVIGCYSPDIMLSMLFEQ